jgi:hypothetical protein
MLVIRKALVIAPKKVAEATWTAEAERWDHLRMLRIQTVLGSAQKRIRALYTPADVYVIGRDNVSWLVRHYKNDWPFDMVVVDELSSFKNPSAKRFKDLRAVLPHIRRVVGLTGTPAPNGLEDLWAQVYLLDQGQRLGKTIGWFRDQYFKRSGNPNWPDYKELPGAEEAVQAAIKDICFSLSAGDYLTMPELIVNDVPVALDSPATAAYREMERKMLLEVDETTITATTAAVLTGKLLQLCAGALYTDTSGVAQVHDCKIEALQELVEGLHGQHALLFYGYRHDIPRITKALAGQKLRIRQYAGPADADAWNRGEIDILLAHPASCAYGLNLQKGGHHVIWYGLTWSLELYQQANARLYRQGQQHPVVVHRLLVVGGMDEQVAEVLEGKRDTQDALMYALRARIAKVKGGGLMNLITKYALTLVAAERQRQDDKWGDQSGNHPFEWMSILMEEVGELAEAVNETCFQTQHIKPDRGGPGAIKREAVQVAAVAVAIVEAIVRKQSAEWGVET